MTIKTITVHELRKRFLADPALCLIDVREDHEWEELRIPGAKHVPKDSLVANIATITSDHDCPIYLHCLRGLRSLQAANALLDVGYHDVYSVEGGIAEWAHAGYPTES